MMKPLGNIYALDGDKTLFEQKEEIINSPYSRIAVYEKDAGNIIGVCQQRVLLREIAKGNRDTAVKDLENVKVELRLTSMRQNNGTT